jgi:hypothetical protein
VYALSAHRARREQVKELSVEARRCVICFVWRVSTFQQC